MDADIEKLVEFLSRKPIDKPNKADRTNLTCLLNGLLTAAAES